MILIKTSAKKKKKKGKSMGNNFISYTQIVVNKLIF